MNEAVLNRMTVRRAIILMLVLLLAIIGGIPHPQAADAAASSKAVATYVSPERIKFVSYSRQWNQQKLQALYKELMKNLHGEELAYLGSVIVSSESREDEAGIADLNFTWTEDDMSDIELDKGTVITLYDGNVNKTVESMAATLSHEYGHHFTYYWLLKKEHKLPSDPTTKWAGIRGLKGHPVFFSEDTDDPDYTHYWDPAEIMADDYMALFGSPTAKLAMVNSLKQEDGVGFYGGIENETIPSVMTLPDVRNYWLKLSGLKDPQPLVFKEPKLTRVEAVKTSGGGISHKLTFNAASTNTNVAKRLQYMVVWEDDEYIDFTPLTTGKLSIVVPDGLPKAKLTLRVYVYDPQTKQYAYARPVTYDLRNSSVPKRAA